MTVIAEDMAPGDRIPTHRHPEAEELIMICFLSRSKQ